MSVVDILLIFEFSSRMYYLFFNANNNNNYYTPYFATFSFNSNIPLNGSDFRFFYERWNALTFLEVFKAL